MKERNLATHTNRLPSPLIHLVAAIGSISVSLSAIAQEGLLRYGPADDGGAGPGAVAPTSIPTLGGTGLVLLSALLMFIFWRLYRKGRIQGARFLTVALVSGALASGLSGIKLVSDAMAQTAPKLRAMTEAGGGTLQFNIDFGYMGCVYNDTEVALEILEMTSLNGVFVNTVSASDAECEYVFPDGSPEYDHPGCAVEMVLQPEEVCGASVGANVSDVRLKEDIVHVGMHESGLALYEFRYLGETKRYRGVMAQEVLNHTPEAVVVMPNGYYAVNYDMLGLEMTEVH